MGNWWVRFLATLGFLSIFGGLLVLAIPGPYEGIPLHTLSPSHSFSLMDLVGSGLVIFGGGIAWGAGVLWQRWMGGRE